MMKKIIAGLTAFFAVFTLFPSGVVSATTLASQPVALYSTTLRSEFRDNRYWPTLRIWQKIGDKPPEILVNEIGRVGENPVEFLLSPDKQTLLVNLESKIAAVNLETKTVTTLFTPRIQVGSMAFSQNGKELVIWDQNYFTTGENPYHIHRYSFITKELQTIHSGTTEQAFRIRVWRPDDVLLLVEGRGEMQKPWYFDMRNKILYETSGDGFFNHYSPRGDYLITVIDEITDPCNAFSGTSPNIYAVLNPLTGERVGSFGDPSQIVEVVAFSPSDKEILYASYAPPRNESECSIQPTKEYYRYNLDTLVTNNVANPKDLLRSWYNEKLAFFEEREFHEATGTRKVLFFNEREFLNLEDKDLIDYFLRDW